MEKTITINGKIYRLKRTLRAVLDYEKDKGKQVIETLSDQIKMFYYLLKNANRKKTDDCDKFTMGYEAFLDALDDDMDLFTTFQEQEEEPENEKPEGKKK